MGMSFFFSLSGIDSDSDIWTRLQCASRDSTFRIAMKG